MGEHHSCGRSVRPRPSRCRQTRSWSSKQYRWRRCYRSPSRKESGCHGTRRTECTASAYVSMSYSRVRIGKSTHVNLVGGVTTVDVVVDRWWASLLAITSVDAEIYLARDRVCIIRRVDIGAGNGQLDLGVAMVCWLEVALQQRNQRKTSAKGSEDQASCFGHDGQMIEWEEERPVDVDADAECRTIRGFICLSHPPESPSFVCFGRWCCATDITVRRHLCPILPSRVEDLFS